MNLYRSFVFALIAASSALACGGSPDGSVSTEKTAAASSGMTNINCQFTEEGCAGNWDWVATGPSTGYWNWNDAQPLPPGEQPPAPPPGYTTSDGASFEACKKRCYRIFRFYSEQTQCALEC